MKFVRLWIIATAAAILLTTQLTLSSHFRGGFITFFTRNVNGKKVVTFNVELGWRLSSWEAVDSRRICKNHTKYYIEGIRVNSTGPLPNEMLPNTTSTTTTFINTTSPKTSVTTATTVLANTTTANNNYTHYPGNHSITENTTEAPQYITKISSRIEEMCTNVPVNLTRRWIWLGESVSITSPTRNVSQSLDKDGFQIQETEFNLTADTRNAAACLGFESCCWVYKGLDWNLTARVIHGIRNDTGKDNQSPTVSVLPVNRIPNNCMLGTKASTIVMNMRDYDGDKIACEVDKHCGESCDETVKLEKENKIKVTNENSSCLIKVDGTSFNIGGEELLIALRVYDYTEKSIMIDSKQLIAKRQPLSSIPVQFYAQIHPPQTSLGCDKVPFWIHPTPKHETIFQTGVTIPFRLILRYNPLSTEISNLSEVIVSGIPDISVKYSKNGECEAIWTPPLKDINRNRSVCFFGRGVDGRRTIPRCYTLHVYGKNCNESSIIGKGTLTYSNQYWWNSTVEARCDKSEEEEVFLIPPAAKYRRCAFNETWLGSVPNCTEVKCKPLPQMERSTLSCPSRSWKRVCSYTCDNGYRKQINCLRQNEKKQELKCSDYENPTWVDTESGTSVGVSPCQLIQCPDITPPIKGFNFNMFQVLLRVKARESSNCPLVSKGASTLLALLQNGAVPLCTGVEWGHSCGFHCYRTNQRLQLIKGEQPLWLCDKEGKWTGNPYEIQCEDIKCSSELPPGIHSTVDTCTSRQGDYPIGTQCNYTCDTGYVALISERDYNYTCDPSGEWIGLAPLCVPDEPPQVSWEETAREDLNCSADISYNSPFGYTTVKIDLPEFITTHHYVQVKRSCNYDNKEYLLWWGIYHVNCTGYDVETGLSSHCGYIIVVTGWKTLIGIGVGTLAAIILTPICIKVIRQFQRRRPAPDIDDFYENLDASDNDDYDDELHGSDEYVQPIYPVHRHQTAS